MQKVEHDLFRNSESIASLLLDWISKNETEKSAIEKTVQHLCELMKELAAEEMDDYLNNFLADIGDLLVFLSKQTELRECLE